MALFDLGILLASHGGHSLSFFFFFPTRHTFIYSFTGIPHMVFTLFPFFFLTRYAFIYLFLQRIPSYKLIILFNWR